MKKLLNTVLILCLILCGCDSKEATKPVPEKLAVSTRALPKPPETHRVSFVGVGDNLIHDVVYMQANRHAGGNGRGRDVFDFKPMYTDVADIIAEADIAYINQETLPVTDPGNISTYPLFGSPAQLIYDMKDIGFDVFAQASNHSFDKGDRGVRDAYGIYESLKNEIYAVGIYKKDEQNFRLVEKNGIRIGFVGYTDLTNGMSLPASSDYYIPLTRDYSVIEKDLEYAKKSSDFVVVLVHWGVENSHNVSARQKELAQLFARSGADVVVGTHPHVIQPIEYVDDTLVIYSLGNFISAQLNSANMVEGMISFDFVKTRDKKSIENVTFTPLINYFNYSFRDIAVYTLSSYEEKNLAISHKLGTTAEYARGLTNKVVDKKFLLLE